MSLKELYQYYLRVGDEEAAKEVIYEISRKEGNE